MIIHLFENDIFSLLIILSGFDFLQEEMLKNYNDYVGTILYSMKEKSH